jgi:hypothetical protein
MGRKGKMAEKNRMIRAHSVKLNKKSPFRER